MNTIEARLDAIESQGAIADLIHAYARGVRHEAYDDLAALFVPDGTFEVRSGHLGRSEFIVRSRFETPGALVAFLNEAKGRTPPLPLLHNLMIEVSGDTAQANSMMAAPILGTGKEVLGEYHDSFVRQGGRWLFSARIYTIYSG